MEGERRVIGIPQGGKISGLLANLYLSDFDYYVCKIVRASHDVRYVRYADDFLVMCKSMSDLNLVRSLIVSELNKLKLKINENKTKVHAIQEESLEYIGFDVAIDYILPSSKNIAKLKNRIVSTLQNINVDSLRTFTHGKIIKNIVWRLNNKVYGFSNSCCPKCGGTQDGRPKSWIGFFAASTRSQIFRDIDIWLRKTLYRYLWENFRVSASRKQLKEAKLASFEREYYRVRKLKACLCGTEIGKNGNRPVSSIDILSLKMEYLIIEKPPVAWRRVTENAFIPSVAQALWT